MSAPQPATAGQTQLARWHEIIEAGGSVGLACRVDRKNGQFRIRSRYAVASDSEYRVRYQTWTWKNGRKKKLDRTGWLEAGAKGSLKTARYTKAATRDAHFLWTIRIHLKDVGWLSYDLTKSQIKRC